jgi:hypothetical protein
MNPSLEQAQLITFTIISRRADTRDQAAENGIVIPKLRIDGRIDG